ncbi:hypothetical protein FF38_01462 [Lucilia cuprina]|uniref:Uncharacterized protein n=1 Tax=Lucilia cuprina TaxID=7375 RepID=A0A0L0BVM3_LUCCU|nr:hypothetical protein FF38_01462 [Lucilia cuprina]
MDRQNHELQKSPLACKKLKGVVVIHLRALPVFVKVPSLHKAGGTAGVLVYRTHFALMNCPVFPTTKGFTGICLGDLLCSFLTYRSVYKKAMSWLLDGARTSLAEAQRGGGDSSKSSPSVCKSTIVTLGRRPAGVLVYRTHVALMNCPVFPANECFTGVLVYRTHVTLMNCLVFPTNEGFTDICLEDLLCSFLTYRSVYKKAMSWHLDRARNSLGAVNPCVLRLSKQKLKGVVVIHLRSLPVFVKVPSLHKAGGTAGVLVYRTHIYSARRITLLVPDLTQCYKKAIDGARTSAVVVVKTTSSKLRSVDLLCSFLIYRSVYKRAMSWLIDEDQTFLGSVNPYLVSCL